jgi:hypothetical protein
LFLVSVMHPLYLTETSETRTNYLENQGFSWAAFQLARVRAPAEMLREGGEAAVLRSGGRREEAEMLTSSNVALNCREVSGRSDR